jgi:hypothetical protein
MICSFGTGDYYTEGMDVKETGHFTIGEDGSMIDFMFVTLFTASKDVNATIH